MTLLNAKCYILVFLDSLLECREWNIKQDSLPDRSSSINSTSWPNIRRFFPSISRPNLYGWDFDHSWKFKILVTEKFSFNCVAFGTNHIKYSISFEIVQGCQLRKERNILESPSVLYHSRFWKIPFFCILIGKKLEKDFPSSHVLRWY